MVFGWEFIRQLRVSVRLVPRIRLVIAVVVHLRRLPYPVVAATQVRLTGLASAQDRCRLTAKIGTIQFVRVRIVVLIAKKEKDAMKWLMRAVMLLIRTADTSRKAHRQPGSRRRAHVCPHSRPESCSPVSVHGARDSQRNALYADAAQCYAADDLLGSTTK